VHGDDQRRKNHANGVRAWGQTVKIYYFLTSGGLMKHGVRIFVERVRIASLRSQAELMSNLLVACFYLHCDCFAAARWALADRKNIDRYARDWDGEW